MPSDKYDIIISEHQIPSVLRSVADSIEGRESADSDNSLPENLSDFEKIEIRRKKKSDGVTVKIKIKPKDEENKAGNTKKKYKKLKKQIKDTYKEISIAIENGDSPDAETVDNFIRQSELLTSYKGKGEEHYEAYLKACYGFRDASQTDSIKQMRETKQRIDDIKDSCHKEYK